MGTQKFVDLPNLGAAPAQNDLIVMHDVDAGQDKVVSFNDLSGSLASGRVTDFDVVKNQSNNWTGVGFDWSFLLLWVSRVEVGTTEEWGAADGELSSTIELFPLAEGRLPLIQGDQWDSQGFRWPLWKSGSGASGSASIVCERISGGLNFETVSLANNATIDFNFLARA